MTTTFKPTRLVPTEAIANIDALVAHAGLLVANLKMEADEIALNWEGIESVGGARDDHAAMLLGRLRAHLGEIATWALIVDEQVEDMVRDPFNRGE